MNEVEKKLEALGIVLDAGPDPMANYVSVQKAGNIWFFSGAGPFKNGKLAVFGRLGENMTTEEGYQAARLAGINLLAILKRELGGNWDKLEQIVKLQGFSAVHRITMNNRRSSMGCPTYLWRCWAT